MQERHCRRDDEAVEPKNYLAFVRFMFRNYMKDKEFQEFYERRFSCPQPWASL